MRMQAVDLAAALALLLLKNHRSLIERPLEDRFQFLVTLNLACDVATGSAQIGLERPQRLAGPLELLGMGIALMPDQRLLGSGQNVGLLG